MTLIDSSEIREISVPGGIPDIPDEETKSEFLAYENNKRGLADLKEIEEIKLLQIKNALEYEKVENEKQNRADRKTYANRIFTLMVWWLIAIFALIIASAFHEILYFDISDKVLITIIGGTTANVLGVFAIVAKYLFDSKSNHAQTQKDKQAKKNPKDK